MTSLFLSPHGDDETLFGSWTILRYKPHVIICLRSEIQELRGTGITQRMRGLETAAALACLGDPTWEQWGFSDASPDWDAFEDLLRRGQAGWGRVFAPAFEIDGHEQHNAIALIAQEVFGDRVEPYLTYRRGSGRTVGAEVEFEPEWPAKKLRALACYGSQIAEPSTAYWFLDSGLREYVP